MKYTVLYEKDGRILALQRVRESARDERGIARPQSGVEPGKGQQVAIVEVDERLRDKSPLELMKEFTVVGERDRVSLRESKRPRQT